jgi:ABC-type nitrate/sulfonate/bicarbonate transport system substrate-binding protein
MILALLGCGDDLASCLDVGYLDFTGSAPYFVAEGLDLFGHFSTCVEGTSFATSNQLIDALAAGRIDYVAAASAAPALALHAQAPDRFFLTSASEVSPDLPFDAILVRDTSSITDLEDLVGTRIAVFPGTTNTALLRHFLAERGVEAASITFVQTPPASQLASLRSGVVDAAHVSEPTWTIGLQDPTLRQLFGTVYGAQLAPNPQGVSLLSRAALRRDPTGARNLVAAFDSALAFMRGNPDSTRAMLRSHFTLPGDAVGQMHLSYMRPHDAIDWDAVRAYVGLLQEVGELSTTPDIAALRLPDAQ